LAKVGTAETCGPSGKVLSKEKAQGLTQANIARLDGLQFRLYAESRRSVLIVLQAMDAGGKDGVIRTVFGGLNNQGVQVTSFGKPTAHELAKDFLWRVHQHVPARGHIGIFNRSHYEDILIVRVHGLVPRKVWQRRYAHIRNFEQSLVDEGTVILKFMLHISKEEQKQRLQARLEDKTRNWKFDVHDLSERKRWDEYQRAYEDALLETSTRDAPWYVVPADKKWFRNYAISTIVRAHLEAMDLRFPPPPPGLDGLVID
jgi:PPK2 family polyphosphate:nucleotide phosphotransferase